MPGPTLATLRTRARIRADQAESDFPTNAQYTTLINECALEVFGDLVGAGYPIDPVAQTITATGAASYVLNSGESIVGVTSVLQRIGSEYFTVRRVDQSQIAALRSASAVGMGPAGFYEVRQSFTLGPIIEFLPTPATGTFRVEFIQVNGGLGDMGDSSVWFGPFRSDELIVLAAAAKALRKEGETADANALDEEYKQLFTKVVNQASWLDMRNPAKIRDVEGGTRHDLFDYNVSGPDRY